MKMEGSIRVSTHKSKMGALPQPVSYTHLDVYKRQMLDYLAKKDVERYRAIIAKLGIRK